MRTVYTISEGSYSDYGVKFIFGDETLRDRLLTKLNLINDNEYFGEEFQLIETEDDVVVQHTYYVFVDREGNETSRFGSSSVYSMSQQDLFDDAEGHTSDRDLAWAKINNWYVGGTSHRGYDQALKAARDRAGIRRAEEEGVV